MNIWSDCKKLPLTEVLSFIVDNRGKTVPTTTSGHILIATNCIKNDRLYPCYEKIRFLSEDTYQSFFRSHPIPGDILFVCKGTPGRCALVPDPIDFCIAQDMVGLRANKSIIDNKYLLAVLRSYEIQKFIYNTSVGDVIPHFKKQFFNKLLIPVPPMELQTKIGAFYYSISQKIENNNKINANLEAQAQALFKSWFVDFTPFKDQPFVDSELGPIPQGWKVGKINEFVDVIYGAPYKSKLFNTQKEGLPLIRIRDLKTSSPQFYTKELLPNTELVNYGDVVAGMDAEFTPHIWLGETGLLNQRVCKFKPHTGISPLYSMLMIKPKLEFAQNYKVGTTVSHLGKSDIDKFIVIVPPLDIVKEVSSIFDAVLNEQINLAKENQRLAALRDTLLPKLMSGEIKL